jgi:hypothetical protein
VSLARRLADLERRFQDERVRLFMPDGSVEPIRFRHVLDDIRSLAYGGRETRELDLIARSVGDDAAPRHRLVELARVMIHGFRRNAEETEAEGQTYDTSD